jgi:hypothetical protein
MCATLFLANVSHFLIDPKNHPKSVIRLWSFWSAKLLQQICFTARAASSSRPY